MEKMTNCLNINILGFEVNIHSDSVTVLNKLSKDFKQFIKQSNNESKKVLDLKIITQEPPLAKIPLKRATFNRKRSITIDDGSIRYNNYGNELLSIFSFKNETGEIYSLNEDYLHEIAYLLILSRSGKWLDLESIHKIHACGFQYNNTNVAVSMEMGAGKSTLFCELLKTKEVSILSDDTPLVTKKGELLAFPLRVGVCEDRLNEFSHVESQNIYKMFRKEYGEKVLISLDSFENKIADISSKQVLMIGKRVDKDIFDLRKRSYVKTMASLFYHQIVGVGLPIIFEYFWETGIKDFVVKTKIFFKRLRAAHNLACSSHTYSLTIGNNPSRNAKELLKALNKKTI